MKTLFFLLVALVGTVGPSRGQQILCERVLAATGTTTNGTLFFFADLLQPRPDSLRLVNDWAAYGAVAYNTRTQPLWLGGCDTLSAGPSIHRAPVAEAGQLPSSSCTNRRGQMLLAQTTNTTHFIPGRPDTIRTRLALFGRDGRLRWERRLPTQPGISLTGLVEAPGNEYFACGAQDNNRGGAKTLVLGLDSLGYIKWRRTYSSLDAPRDLTYSRRGTLLLTCSYFPSPTAVLPAFGLLVLSQRGDSLSTHPIIIDPLQATRTPMYITGSLQPLRDGGFALVGEVDSANANYFRPFLVRLDANLNVVWFYVHRQQASFRYRFAHPYELADGSLAVLASNSRSGRNEPFWLFRFAPTGALRNRYAFVPQVLPPYTPYQGGYLGLLQGLQPLSDSTFVLASSLNGVTTNGSFSSGYLAHIRVPGLPRVIDSHYLPAALATRSGAALAPEALGPPHPNPATETVAFTYALPGSSAPAVLVLRDVAGRQVLAQALAGRTGTAQLAVAGLPGGLYLATLEVGGQPCGSARKLAVLP